MPSTKAATLSPDVENRIAEIETMTLQQVQGVEMRRLSDVSAGRVTAYEDNALSRAADKRIQVLRRELLTR
jgi:hypothetical protein